ncbi:hypothetical protein Selin_2065 [Desulfurispirillum indicum S5]|uniref:DUF6194 domain-containing protein n=1 Tax=Desulfurispirillum indicum (strain ATCC BAA-1389 / DSM 22839 / S5) TaxID=653733 RepID=E6W2W0_DESIS|nr:DUF6194 family protein [Desulfurispirillum indicum]ADU66785.1 hypothetical protein Selin_2065 [Desulfurispirillum indicum S5]
MAPDEIVRQITARFPGVIPKASWGEVSLFYNPGGVLPNGVYFCTIKDHDGDNDKASALNRDGVFRLAIGLAPEDYRNLFGEKPARPAKGGTVNTGHDFTELGVLMPHPVYAWMGWAQILCPTEEAFAGMISLLEGAHRAAVVKFTSSLQKYLKASR